MNGRGERSLVLIAFLTLALLPAVPCSASGLSGLSGLAGLSEPQVIAKVEAARYNSIAFDDSTIAWIEYGPNEDGIPGSSIHRFDIATGRQETVIVDPSGKFSLDLSGRRYVWSDQRGIFLYDEDESLLTFLYSENPQYNPVIDGDTIVWEEKAGGRTHLRMYDISTGDYSDVAPEFTAGSDCYLPAISGDRLVFASRDRISGEIRLMLHNLTSRKISKVAVLHSIYQPPAIDGDTIAWTDTYDDYYSVCMYDTANGTTSVISPEGGYQMYPDVSGGNVVWAYYGWSWQDANDGGSIYLYDSGTKNATVISRPGSRQDFPKVSGGYVVWTDRSGDANDIYLFKIPGKEGVLPDGADDQGSLLSSFPDPTPDTKIRFYSTIGDGEVQWYTLSPPAGSTQVSFELRWTGPGDELSLSVAGPEGSIWHFSDSSDGTDDSSVRMTISDINSLYDKGPGWTIAVSADSLSEDTAYYDLCWY